LADIGRGIVEHRVKRPLTERLLRRLLIKVVPHPGRFGALLKLGRYARPLLPRRVSAKVPAVRPAGQRPSSRGNRRMIALSGCVQSVATPATNASLARILARLGIALIEPPAAGCCGAAAYHLGAHREGLDAMRRNVDVWWPQIEAGAEVVIVTASGCGAIVKEYGELLAHDPEYAERARRIAALARDPAEVLASEDLEPLGSPGGARKVAFHSPCTLQHGQRLANRVEPILSRLGFELTAIPDGHLCCGSAGTYSITQPALSSRLRDDKLAALRSGGPQVIATANVGCQLHLETGAGQPVFHWLELLDPA
jgi:glycolate oxidase iron-sulfur subunit